MYLFYAQTHTHKRRFKTFSGGEVLWAEIELECVTGISFNDPGGVSFIWIMIWILVRIFCSYAYVSSFLNLSPFFSLSHFIAIYLPCSNTPSFPAVALTSGLVSMSFPNDKRNDQ